MPFFLHLSSISLANFRSCHRKREVFSVYKIYNIQHISHGFPFGPLVCSSHLLATKFSPFISWLKNPIHLDCSVVKSNLTLFLILPTPNLPRASCSTFLGAYREQKNMSLLISLNIFIGHRFLHKCKWVAFVRGWGALNQEK